MTSELDPVIDAARDNKRVVSFNRKARIAAGFSWLFFFLSAMGFAVTLIMLAAPAAPPRTGVVSPGIDSLRALEIEGYKQSGAGLAMLAIALLYAACYLLAIFFARRWAGAALGAMAPAESANRTALRYSRDAGKPFALFLRGFEQEGKSLKSVLRPPLLRKRIVRETRWIEAEIVEEVERKGASVFCIANPADQFLLPGAFRLASTKDDWLNEIGELSVDSALIVIYISARTTGLVTELTLLRDQKLTHKCVVAIDRNVLRQDPRIVDGFPILVNSPRESRFTRSLGVVFGRRRFLNDLKVGIAKASSW